HELSQTGGPLIVVGAGLPHLPSVLSASKSYSERLFRYARIDRLEREAADLALLVPAQREDVTFTPGALDALYAAADGYPYFVQAYGKVTWDVAASSPVTAADVSVAAPEAEGELAVGFFGSRYERATPAEREYMRAMAATGDDPVPTSIVADELGRKPTSLQVDGEDDVDPPPAHDPWIDHEPPAPFPPDINRLRGGELGCVLAPLRA